MKNSIFITGLLFFVCTLANAQVEERFKKKNDEPQIEQKPAEEVVKANDTQPANSDFWDRLVYGGNLGASFGAGASFLYIAPSVGYRVTDNFIAGVGGMLQYSKYQYSNGVSQENSIYGPTAWLNYRPFEFIYLATQFEYLNHDYYYPTTSGDWAFSNIWTSVLFLEGGISQPMGNKGFMMVGIRFNVLDDARSPYTTSWFPVIGVYF